MKYLITLLLLFVGHTLQSQSFQYRGKHDYLILTKYTDSTSTECGGQIKIKMTGKTRYLDFAKGFITVETCDYKIKGRFVSLPYYKGYEFFDISVKNTDVPIRIIMVDGLFGVYSNDSLLSFYDSIKLTENK